MELKFVEFLDAGKKYGLLMGGLCKLIIGVHRCRSDGTT
jgi:hypothetical protein